MNTFDSYRDSTILKEHMNSKHVFAGDHSYYSGYYHGKNFEECIMYLDKKDDRIEPEKIDQLIIGKFCSIATGVQFMMGGTQGHNLNWISAYPLDFLDDDFDKYVSIPSKGNRNKGNTIIGSDVWIGAEAMIMPGIQIGDGSIIGARSLVTKNIGNYEIWGGNPARLIRKRFKDDEIEKLLMLRWWDWSVEKIKQNMSLIRSADIEALWNNNQT